MNAERFQALAEAFGGSITRWPADEQDDAFAFMARQADLAIPILAEARDLDADLDQAERLSPSHALRQAVLGAAPRARAAFAPVRRWLTGAGVGVGLAAAAAAGIVMGVNVSLASAGEDAMLLAAVYSAGLLDDGGGVS
jgi:hypothetical protein